MTVPGPGIGVHSLVSTKTLVLLLVVAFALGATGAAGTTALFTDDESVAVSLSGVPPPPADTSPPEEASDGKRGPPEGRPPEAGGPPAGNETALSN